MHSIIRAARATISATVLLCIVFACTAEDEEYTSNPYATSHSPYVNLYWADNIEHEYFSEDLLPGNALHQQSVGLWLRRTADIEPFEGQHPNEDLALSFHLDQALANNNDLVTLVLANLPGAHCSQADANNALPASAAGLQHFTLHYIGKLKDTLAQEQYQALSIVTIIGVDAIADIANHYEDCVELDNSKPWGYTNTIRYAITELSKLHNVSIYLDVGSAATSGWHDSMLVSSAFAQGVLTGFDQLDVEVIREHLIGDSPYNYTQLDQLLAASDTTSPAPGWKAIKGFVSNVADYVPLVEPWLPNPDDVLGGDMLMKNHEFYQGNPIFGALDYAQGWLQAVQTKGAPLSLGMLIDTSRNGWGGSERPTSWASTGSPEQRIESSRVDRRVNREDTCNQKNAGLGERPTANPAPGIHAYIWAKPPGFSDGISDEDFERDPNNGDLAFEERCASELKNLYKHDSDITEEYEVNALRDQPHRDRWSSTQIIMLIDNAYPPLNQ